MYIFAKGGGVRNFFVTSHYFPGCRSEPRFEVFISLHPFISRKMIQYINTINMSTVQCVLYVSMCVCNCIFFCLVVVGWRHDENIFLKMPIVFSLRFLCPNYCCGCVASLPSKSMS